MEVSEITIEQLKQNDWSIENDDHQLSVFWSDAIGIHTGRHFIVEFNGKLNSFKSKHAMVKKAEKLIQKHGFSNHFIQES